MVNMPQLVGTLEGDVYMTDLDFLRTTYVIKIALKEISKYQHFQFSQSTPSVVYVKTLNSESEKKITLLKQ